jgi:hypothetical protein
MEPHTIKVTDPIRDYTAGVSLMTIAVLTEIAYLLDLFGQLLSQ